MSTEVILTATDAAARQLRRRHDRSQRSAGHSVWEAPAISSLGQWLRASWTGAWPDGQLLQPAMETALWERLIAEDPASAALLSTAAPVRLARQAARIVAAWCIDLEAIACWSPEQQAFRRWHRRWQAALSEQGWIAPASLPQQLRALLAAGRWNPPAAIRLHGHFGPLDTATRALFDALQAQGTRIETAAPGPAASVLNARCLPGIDEQLADIAALLRGALDEAGPEPDLEIVLALPDPAAQLDALELALTPELAPWLEDPALPAAPANWRTDLGPRALALPAVAALRDLAALRKGRNDSALVSALLLQPMLWSAAEREALAAVELRLRERGGLYHTLADLRRLLPEDRPDSLDSRLDALDGALQRAPRRALPSDWAQFWQALPELGGLPAPEAWQEALPRMAAMDRLLGAVSQSEALRWFDEILAAQPASTNPGHTPPLLITDLETAATLRCDLLVLAELDDGQLPGPAQRLPLIEPSALQLAGVPDCTADARLRRMSALCDALRGCAPRLELRCATLGPRQESRQPTALFGCAWEPAPPRAVQRPAQTPLVAQEDPVPAVSAEELPGIGGGSGIFRHWAEAPFFAFCRARLGVEPLPEMPSGLPAARQGQLIHEVLEILWNGLGDSATLAALNDEALQRRIDDAVGRCLPRYLPPASFGAALTRLEAQRVADVVRQWLDHERRRVDPFQAIAFEQALETAVGGLPLRLVIDRVDRVQTADGDRYLILDYKTGNTETLGGWKGARLADPQLPLYAACATTAALGIPRTDGICKAHVADGRPAFLAATNWRKKLIVDDPRPFHTDWEGQLSEWRTALLAAAVDFLGGGAGLDPARNYSRSYNAGLCQLARLDHG